MASDAKTAQCDCSAVQFTIDGPPLFRILCHCTICQAFNDAAFADIVVYRARQVAAPSAEQVHFDRWRPPPNVQRGVCTACEQPIIEQFRAPLMPSLTMVPAARIDGDLPPPCGHLFYEHRRDDAKDDLPRHHGYWASQWAFMRALFRNR